MKDLTLKFESKAAFAAFKAQLNWDENEALQDDILLDVIGNVYEGDEDNLVAVEGYFVNVRILDDDHGINFEQYAVVLDSPLRQWA
ncbi:hypothetical protein bas17_0029 [Escherichia phage KarlBarth]|uniref:Prophage protein n=2 Tax=Dhillonvirus TaxID=1623289 RepID=A0AAE7VVK8_9CAUD|nr:hypothetical protein P9601_gp60 [Escherichia phage rolling]YP_010740623.1 hypothetical protein P9602_gp29 [Escherichia phage KarlBarth]QHR66359.1 hypothetical protein rolling_60 [Escherichia phage rolling]QXV81945.1 hypothetical protein bas17_0029 [Escherichia phage KarlBarth]